jgi:hypothetical protein
MKVTPPRLNRSLPARKKMDTCFENAAAFSKHVFYVVAANGSSVAAT